MDTSVWNARNFNLGISFGVCGAHAYYGIPNVAIKLPRLTIQGNSFTYQDRSDKTIQLDLDWVRINPYRTNREVYFSLAYGRWWHLRTDLKRFNRHYTLIGVNRYSLNHRSRTSFKIGWSHMDDQRYDRRWGWNGYPEDIPYAEISYSLFLRKFKPGRTVEIKRRNQDTSSHLFGDYANLYLSLGAGLDRAIWAPALGIRLGLVSVQGSFMFLPRYLQGSIHLAVDYGVPYKREDGFARHSLSTFFFAHSGDDLGDIFSLGLMYGRSRYLTGRKLSRHARIGLAFLPLDVSWNFRGRSLNWATPVMPVAAISVNIYTFRMNLPNATKNAQ
ncbi:MAG: hypothetical protein KDC76_11370 [Bacteroidetes bacterium]|nr:hypothetical protein [Bacteroidota bacterium]